MQANRILVQEAVSGTVINAYVSAVTFNSSPIPIHKVYGISFQVSNPSTGTPAGTWSVQTCNDWEGNETMTPNANLVNWTTVSGLNVAISGAGGGFLELFSAARWVRLVYTAGSGSITATATCHIKSMQ